MRKKHTYWGLIILWAWFFILLGLLIAQQSGLLKNVGRCERVGEIKLGFMLGPHPVPLRCAPNHYWTWR